MPWALHASRFTLDFEKMAAWMAQRSDKTTVQHLMGISPDTWGLLPGAPAPTGTGLAPAGDVQRDNTRILSPNWICLLPSRRTMGPV